MTLVLKRFLLQLWIYLTKFGTWVLRPRVYKSILGILGFLIPLGITFYIYFYPKVELSFSDTLNPKNITSSYFTIENNGNCNIYNVFVDCMFINFSATDYSTGSPKRKDFRYIEVFTENIDYRRIKSNRSQLFDVDVLNEIFVGLGPSNDSLVTHDAKIEMYVNYKYWGDRYKIDTFKFKTKGPINGKIVWTKYQ